MNQVETTDTILTRGGNVLHGRLLRQETVSMKEVTYLSSEYDVENYGEVVFSNTPKKIALSSEAAVQ